MRLPRDLSGDQLISKPARLGYHPTRQTGSHVRSLRTNADLLIDGMSPARLFLGFETRPGSPSIFPQTRVILAATGYHHGVSYSRKPSTIPRICS